MTPGNPTPEEEDDLFNFDDLFRGPSKAESATATARVPPALPKPAPAAASAAPAVASTPSQLPLVRPVTPRPPVQTAPLAAAPPVIEPRRAGGLNLAALGLATLVNLALVGVVWRSMSGMDSALREVGDQVARASEPSSSTANTPRHEWQQLMDAAPVSGEGEQALESAAHDLSLGDYERCRVRLYSLLAVVDRFDVKQRSRLTSRAQVLIADSYREQADRVERESATHAGESGFISVPGKAQR